MNIRDFKDADGEAIQPYYAAYMIEHSYRTPAEAKARHGNNLHFMNWIQARWFEFEDATGRRRFGKRAAYTEEFLSWLQARVGGQTGEAA